MIAAAAFIWNKNSPKKVIREYREKSHKNNAVELFKWTPNVSCPSFTYLCVCVSELAMRARVTCDVYLSASHVEIEISSWQNIHNECNKWI